MISADKISCIIVDDEISSQRVLQHFVEKSKIIDLKGVCNNTSEAFQFLQLNPTINVMFLDINMPNQSGLDFYKKLQFPPKVIFTTAYPQYAVEGFEVNAIDYLLKPISYQRFLIAVNKVLQIKSKEKNASNDFIIFKENKALHKIIFNDIEVIETFGDYLRVHTKDNCITTHGTLKKLMETLPNFFIQTHKSFCVNTNKIKTISGNQIQLKTHNVPIGQTFKSKVINALNL